MLIISLKSLILLICIFPKYLQAGKCGGAKMKYVETECSEVENGDIIFESMDQQELNRHASKFSHIGKINGKLILRGNSFEIFEMPNLHAIINDAGSAIVLERNTNLKRFKLHKLRTIQSEQGSPHITVKNDNFPNEAYGNKEAYADLLLLNDVANGGNCQTQNLISVEGIINEKATSFPIIWLIILVLELVAIVVLTVLIIVFYKKKFPDGGGCTKNIKSLFKTSISEDKVK